MQLYYDFGSEKGFGETAGYTAPVAGEGDAEVSDGAYFTVAASSTTAVSGAGRGLVSISGAGVSTAGTSTASGAAFSRVSVSLHAARSGAGAESEFVRTLHVPGELFK